MLYSFDLFGTLWIRTIEKEGVFAQMQDSLLKMQEYADLPISLRKEFAVLRENADPLAARKNRYVPGHAEVRIEEIYEVMAAYQPLTSEQQKRLIRLELETEKKLLRPNLQEVEMLRFLLSRGERVVLITDMYWGERDLRWLIRQVIGADAAKLPLYVSCEIQKTKRSGELFRYVQEQEQVDYREWLHVGDDPKADIEAAGKMGICTRSPRINAVEAKGTVESPVVAAAKDATEPKEIGRTIGGPILYAYACWILDRCREMGIRRLYFIARDGFLPKMLVDLLLEAEDHKEERKAAASIQTHYIYGSRKAWRKVAIGLNRDGDSEYISLKEIFRFSYLERRDSRSDRERVMGLPEGSLRELLPEGFPEQDFSDHPELQRIFEKEVMNRESLHCLEDRILDAQRENRALVRQYLEQELDLSDDAFAFVELGGNGTTQSCLAQLLGRKIKTFYFKMEAFGLYRNLENYVFFPSAKPYHLLMEMVCRAPQEQTCGYHKSKANGRIEPLFDRGEREAYLTHGYDEYMEGIRDYASGQISGRGENGEPLQGLSLGEIDALLQLIGLHPTKAIADFFGDMPNSISGRERKVMPFAPHLTEQEIRHIFLDGKGQKIWKYYGGSSLDYSILRASEEERKLIEYYRNQPGKPKYVRKDLSYLPKRLVLYGAGIRGSKIYPELHALEGHRVIAWADRRAEAAADAWNVYAEWKGADGRQHRKKLTPPSEIATLQYDAVLVTVKDETLFDEIREYLLALGVDRRRIWWFLI